VRLGPYDNAQDELNRVKTELGGAASTSPSSNIRSGRRRRRELRPAAEPNELLGAGCDPRARRRDGAGSGRATDTLTTAP